MQNFNLKPSSELPCTGPPVCVSDAPSSLCVVASGVASTGGAGGGGGGGGGLERANLGSAEAIVRRVDSTLWKGKGNKIFSARFAAPERVEEAQVVLTTKCSSNESVTHPEEALRGCQSRW